FHRLVVVRVRHVEVQLAAGPAGGNIEVRLAGLHPYRLPSVYALEQPHDGSYGPHVALPPGQHDRVARPAGSLEIGGRGDGYDVAVALVGVERARLVDAHQPLAAEHGRAV